MVGPSLRPFPSIPWQAAHTMNLDFPWAMAATFSSAFARLRLAKSERVTNVIVFMLWESCSVARLAQVRIYTKFDL